MSEIVKDVRDFQFEFLGYLFWAAVLLVVVVVVGNLVRFGVISFG